MDTAPTTPKNWNAAYANGNPFAPLRDSERRVLNQLPHPPAGRALDIGSGTGELTRHLAGLGWSTTGVDLAPAAVEIARATASDDSLQIRYLCLDACRDGFDAFPRASFDLITCRLAAAFLDRRRLLALVRHLLRPGGTLLVTTPTIDQVPAERRTITLDEEQISDLRAGFTTAEQHQADDLTMLVLRDPVPSHAVQESRASAANSLFGVGVVVHDPATNQVLLGHSARFPGLLEALGGKPELGESLPDTVAREVHEESGLLVEPRDVQLLGMVIDQRGGLPRITVAAYVNRFTGTPQAKEPHLIERWQWHPVGPLTHPLLQPSLDVLATAFPHAYQSASNPHAYPLAPAATLMQTARHDTHAYPPAGPALREGGCQCGRIRFQATGIPDFAHCCTCGHCQVLSGGPEMSWVSFELTDFTWSGPGGDPAWHYTWPTSKRGHCPGCGSQICALDDGATSIAVPLVSLDDPRELVPVHQSFQDDAPLWRQPIASAPLLANPAPAPAAGPR